MTFAIMLAMSLCVAWDMFRRWLAHKDRYQISEERRSGIQRELSDIRTEVNNLRNALSLKR